VWEPLPFDGFDKLTTPSRAASRGKLRTEGLPTDFTDFHRFGRRSPNIYDVARIANVSIATVSYAMNGKGRVSHETRQRVRTACKTLGYHPHPSARSLPRLHRGPQERTTTDLIAFNVVDLPGTRITYSEILNGVTESVLENRKMIIYQPIEKGKEDSFSWINRHGIDGRLLVGRVDDSVVDVFRAENVPFVIIGDHQCLQPVWNINLDHHAVGGMMVDHLWKLGHRRFLFVGSTRNFAYENEIKRGVEDRLREKGAGPGVYLATDHVDSGISQFDEMMADPATRPTAVLTIEWMCASPILRRAQKLGLQIPRDFSLLAFAPGIRAGEFGLSFVNPSLEEIMTKNTFLPFDVPEEYRMYFLEVRTMDDHRRKNPDTWYPAARSNFVLAPAGSYGWYGIL